MDTTREWLASLPTAGLDTDDNGSSGCDNISSDGHQTPSRMPSWTAYTFLVEIHRSGVVCRAATASQHQPSRQNLSTPF
jgi:hypothetical protein